jgi:hypothetical protein
MSVPYIRSLRTVLIAAVTLMVVACQSEAAPTPMPTEVVSPTLAVTTEIPPTATIVSDDPVPVATEESRPSESDLDAAMDAEIAKLFADSLDFTGSWSRRPRPEGAYEPQGKDEFPLETELHFEEQICLVRLSGVGACPVVYWVYGSDWIEISQTNNPRRIVDGRGQEEFVVDYVGTYHHTHSFFTKTVMADEMKRNEKDGRAAWDMGASPIEFMFEIAGTVSYSPESPSPLRIRFEGKHQGDLVYTHAISIGMSYTGQIPDAGTLPINVGFRDEVRASNQPEGTYRGNDQAYSGTFYSASISPTGAVAGVINSRVTSEPINNATVKLFVPGQVEMFASTNVNADGSFEFTELPIIRTDNKSSGPSDVYGTQYTIEIENPESGAGDERVSYKDKRVSARPFSAKKILLDPAVTHFIAVGDRPVDLGVELVYHYSLEYWECGGEFDPLHQTDGFTPDEIVAKCEALDPIAKPKKLGEVELLARGNWSVWAGVNDVSGTGRSWIEQGLLIAEIVYWQTAATKLMPIYAGSEREMSEIWATVIETAENYEWAEQLGFADENNFTRWPGSMYQPLQTNSNTFIRYLVNQSKMSWVEMDGSHPGNDVPSQNTELDLLRDVTVYAEHTPWFGDDAKSEPEAPPP